MDKSFIYYELIEALNRPGCSVCALIERHSLEHIEAVFYESVNDPETRSRLRSSFGFCKHHAEIAVRIGSPLAFALIYEDVLNALDKAIARSARTGRVVSSVKCLLCEQELQQESRLIQALATSLEEEEMQCAYKISAGLCAHHLIRLITACSLPIRQLVVEVERERIRELRDELMDLIRKNDYRFAKEAIGKEGDSWLRAISKVAGRSIERKGILNSG